MPKYLFTSDQRINSLSEKVKWVASFIDSGHLLSEITDKSENNNAATLKFYYNLQDGTEVCLKAKEEPLYAIRNFVLKFQFPNPRTSESLADSLEERTLFAPFRSVVKMLYLMAKESDFGTSWLSSDEILYYFFCNPYVFKNPLFDCDVVKKNIEKGRGEIFDIKDEISAKLEWKQYDRQIRELFTVLTIAYPCFEFSSKRISLNINSAEFEANKDFVLQLLDYSKFWYPTNPFDFNLSTSEYISYMDTKNTPYSVIDFKLEYDSKENKSDNLPLQQIFYGAPGTGKSHKVKEVTNELPKSNVFRTTFHPDSDYSTFVGCYKPKMVKAPIRDSSGHEITSACEDEKKRIAYEYEPQAFLKAYVRAYETNEPVFLVIEEINRGNCAQIFGDMFQLLDRNGNGESDYAIKPETAIQEFLNDKLKDCDIADETIKSGEEMRLPANLYIWATMNTSDQSLFPIDSAFKRRWDWKYVPIDYEKEEWSIVAKGVSYSWSDFLKKMNNLVASTTDSEDKMLGFYFAKAKDGIIDADTFVGKVVFYLWNDVFKDYGLPKEILNGAESKEFAFRNFFMIDGSANEDMVKRLLENIGVAKDSDIPIDESISTDDIVNNMVGGKKDTSRYKINGTGSYPKTDLATEVMKVYVTNHPGKPVNDIISEWTSLNVAITDIVTDEAAHNLKKSKTSDPRFDYRTGKVQVGTEVLFVTRCWAIENVSDFVEKVNARSWGVHIETV